jgi:chromosome partitioning protein
MSKVIVLATSKGGAGKSTLTRSLACHYYNTNCNVAVIDADPQGSIINRHDVNGPVRDLPIFCDPDESVYSLIEEKKSEHSPLLVDTGGFRNRTTVMAILMSDIVLIPLKPSSDDVAGALETCRLIHELNDTPERSHRPILYKLVLTMSQKGTVIAKHVRDELEKQNYPLLQSELYHRVSYPEASIRGLAPNLMDPEGAAGRDIAAIVQEINEALR